MPVQPKGHGVPFVQWPVRSHVCGTSLLHRRVVGTHSPVHAPLLQRNAHWVPFIHWPMSLHVWIVRLSEAHLGALPGMHTPQTPAPTQKSGQGWPSLWYVPLASQSCGCLPLHVRMPGGHAPAHAPLTQTLAQAGPLFIQCPVASQSCGCLPVVHCLDRGVQSAQTPLPRQTPGHAPVASFCH